MLKAGQRLLVEFSCRLADGSPADSSGPEGQPREFIFGSPDMPPGFARALDEMRVGETRSFALSAEDAYGAWDEALVEAFPVDSIPNAADLPVGDHIIVGDASGRASDRARVKVLKIEEGQVFLDFNYELAGQDLYYTVKLVDLPGLTGSNIDLEKSLTGGCSCGCDELKQMLSPHHEHAHEHHEARHEHHHT